jgi:hypothetical protein
LLFLAAEQPAVVGRSRQIGFFMPHAKRVVIVLFLYLAVTVGNYPRTAQMVGYIILYFVTAYGFAYAPAGNICTCRKSICSKGKD